jgi:hypothetical protein
MDHMFYIVLIVALVVGSRTLRTRYTALAKIEALRGDNTENAALAREVAALNSRIAVLERIITENRSSRDLAHEIDALRDR